MFKSIATVAAIFVSNAATAQALDLSAILPSGNIVVATATSDDPVVTPETQVTAKEIARIANLGRLETAFNQVCTLADEEKVILSAKAMENCTIGAMPKAFKSGKKFTKAKTGAEFNTLIANLPIFTADEG